MPPTPLFPAPTHSKERGWHIPQTGPPRPSHLLLQAHKPPGPWAKHSFLAPGEQHEPRANKRADREGDAPSPESMRARYEYQRYQKREAKRRAREAAERRERKLPGVRTPDDPLSLLGGTDRRAPAPSAWKHHDPLNRPERFDAGSHLGRPRLYEETLGSRRAGGWDRWGDSERADGTSCCVIV